MKTTLRILSRKLFSRIYKPKLITHEAGCSRLQNALVITDYHDNLSFSSGGKLHATYRTQLINSEVTPAEYNRFLTGQLLPLSPPRRLQGLSISLLSLWGNNYYHWLFDCLPRWMSIKTSGLISKRDDPKILITNLQHRFHLETLQLLGLNNYRITTFKRLDFISCDELIVAPHPNPDFSMLTGEAETGQGVSDYAVDILRESFLPLTSPASNSTRRIYLTRGDTARRSIANECELISLLRQRNFEVIDPAALSFREQVELASQAEWIVAIHGAALANAVFASPGCHVLELFDPAFQPGIYKSLCKRINAVYHSLILEAKAGDALDSRQLICSPCSLEELTRILPSS
jgi:capsular polysaccharide biosynthesis protein